LKSEHLLPFPLGQWGCVQVLLFLYLLKGAVCAIARTLTLSLLRLPFTSLALTHRLCLGQPDRLPLLPSLLHHALPHSPIHSFFLLSVTQSNNTKVDVQMHSLSLSATESTNREGKKEQVDEGTQRSKSCQRSMGVHRDERINNQSKRYSLDAGVVAICMYSDKIKTTPFHRNELNSAESGTILQRQNQA